jgi:hypothetical protein
MSSPPNISKERWRTSQILEALSVGGDPEGLGVHAREIMAFHLKVSPSLVPEREWTREELVSLGLAR